MDESTRIFPSKLHIPEALPELGMDLHIPIQRCQDLVTATVVHPFSAIASTLILIPLTLNIPGP